MPKLTPPSKKNITRRLKFFLDNRTYPNALYEIFHLSNLIINRDLINRKIDYPEYHKRIHELQITGGLPELTKSALEKLEEKLK